MSNAPSTLDTRTATGVESDRPASLPALVRTVRRSLQKSLQFAGFWSSILLAVLYVPILVVGLPEGQRAAFAVLLALHAVALVVGHGYRGE